MRVAVEGQNAALCFCPIKPSARFDQKRFRRISDIFDINMHKFTYLENHGDLKIWLLTKTP